MTNKGTKRRDPPSPTPSSSRSESSATAPAPVRPRREERQSVSGQPPSSSSSSTSSTSSTNPLSAATSSTPSPRPYVNLSHLPVRFRPTRDPWAEGSRTSGSRPGSLIAGIRRMDPAGGPPRIGFTIRPAPPRPRPILTPPPPPRPLPLPAPVSSPEPQESRDSDDGDDEDEEDEPIEERGGYVNPLEAYVDKDAGRGYLYLTTLSAGEQGTIIKVLAIDEDWEDDREIVLKIFSSVNKESWLQEVQGYERVSNPGHPNVLKYYGGFYYCDQRCIAMDLADSNLQEHEVANRDQMSRRHIQDLARGICRGLNYLHSMGVVHRDIKPENILLTASQEALVSDLGLSDALDEKGQATGDNGTDGFRAPEIEGTYTTKVDAFSFGALLHELIHGVVPEKKKGSEKRVNMIKKWRHARDLVDGLLRPDPESRLSIDQALQQSFFIQDQGNLDRNGRKLVAAATSVAQTTVGDVAPEAQAQSMAPAAAEEQGCEDKVADPEENDDDEVAETSSDEEAEDDADEETGEEDE
ncbi:hypothetical protein EC957_003406 [Mortierella hygrophila]|uniref:non-specific serine/threonine protein kinase n=1 Tax=Mortierella hygrophila TaxID=979708 RepID=A0A9P6K0V0_9FUNG|nr:hypothetical protein EC957_003406 [Mortierella hygrophila]